MTIKNVLRQTRTDANNKIPKNVYPVHGMTLLAHVSYQ